MTQAVLVGMSDMNCEIKNELERLPLLWFFSVSAAVLTVVSITSHFSLIFNGIVFMNSDYAFQSLEADEFRRGAWSAFSTGQNYGGVTLSALRPLWTAVWESVFSEKYPSWVAHTSFTFGLSPVLMTLAAFYLIQAYCSRLAALASGLIAAVGFQFWVSQYGNDFYVAYILLCMVLLARRAGISHPLVELSYQKLLFAGIISGLALYTYRPSLIYIFVFFCPIGFALPTLRRIACPKDRIENVLLGVAMTFLILFVYLWLFGDYAGTVNSQKLKLRAVPNLIFCMVVLVVLIFKAFWNHLNADIWYRTAVVALGGLIGLLPEIFYCFEQRSFPNRIGTLSPIETFLSVAGMVPASFRTLVSGNNAFGQPLTQYVSIILFLWAGCCLIKESKRRPKFQPVVLAGALSLLMYCTVSTYVSGPPRYLFSIFPVLLVALGLLIDRVLIQGQWGHIGIMLGAILISGHIVHQQFFSKKAIEQAYLASGHMENLKRVSSVFEKNDISFVFSDDYWHSHQYTLENGWRVRFYAPRKPLAPKSVIREAENAKMVGVFLASQHRDEQRTSVEILGRKWNLLFLERIGNRALYKARHQGQN